jgi:hypothetical protein
VQYAAEKGYGYSQVFTPIAAQLKSFESYRSRTVKHGHTPDAESIIISAICGLLRRLTAVSVVSQRGSTTSVSWGSTSYMRSPARGVRV